MPKAAPSPAPRLPQEGFAERDLPLAPAGHSTWMRLHHRKFGPVHFSKLGLSRWDHPDGVGAMCVGLSLEGIVLERFGDELQGAGAFLTHSNVSEYLVTSITIPAASKPAFVDTRASLNLWRIGADSQLCSGPYTYSQAWSLALMSHPSQPRGVLYPSRHDQSLTNLVLFNRRALRRGIRAGKSCTLKDHRDFNRMLATLHLGVSPPPRRRTEKWAAK